MCSSVPYTTATCPTNFSHNTRFQQSVNNSVMSACRSVRLCFEDCKHGHAYTCACVTSVFAFVCLCVFVCVCVMYGLWKLAAGVQSRCQVAAGNMKESLSRGGDWSANLTYRINVLIKEQMTRSEERLTSHRHKEKETTIWFQNIKAHMCIMQQNNLFLKIIYTHTLM